jgi:hypothetical protein
MRSRSLIQVHTTMIRRVGHFLGRLLVFATQPIGEAQHRIGAQTLRCPLNVQRVVYAEEIGAPSSFQIDADQLLSAGVINQPSLQSG